MTGQTEQNEKTDVKDYNEVRHSEQLVRDVRNPDGTLYAYRDGDEHVVVSRGNEPATRWTRRVPACRAASISAEQLWTIPDNWEHRVNSLSDV